MRAQFHCFLVRFQKLRAILVTSKLFTCTRILTDGIGAIEWEGSRPSQQIPNSTMIVPRSIALHTKYQIDVCGTIKVKLMINLSKINTID
jgi:hypothetical protein